MYKIISLDQSTSSTGLAIFSSDGILLSSRVLLPKKSDKDAFERIWTMYKQIRTIIKEEKPDRVILEDVQLTDVGRNVMVLKQLARLQGCLIGLCYECGVYFEFIYPSTWRSALGFLKGKKGQECSRANMKQMSIDYVNEKYNMNLTIKQNDLSEAICIGEAYYKMLDKNYTP